MRKSLSRTKSRLACAGMTAGVVVAALLATPQAAFAAISAFTLTPAAGPIGTVVTATATGGNITATSGILLTTLTTCPSYSATANATTVPATVVPTTTPSTSATFTIPNSTVLVTAANGVPKTYTVCLYEAISAPTAFIQGTNAFTLTPPVTVGMPTGPSGGGNTLAVSSGANPIFAATPGVLFASGSCPTAYPASPGAGQVVATGVTRTSTSAVSVIVPPGVLGSLPPGAGPTPVTSPYNVCFYAAATTNAVQIGSAVGAYGVLLPPATPATTTGPGGGNGITVTFGNNALINAPTPGVAFTTAAVCPTTYPASGGGTVLAAAGSPRRLSSTRLAVTVPTISVGNYLMCVYNATTLNSSPLVAAANYAAVVVPTPTAIVPRSGPALGNNPITVIGTNFPTAPGQITATLGGAPLMNITPVSDTAFTAVAPPHSVEVDVPLIINTVGGTRVLQAAYTYNNSIQVAPNTAANTMPSTDVSVQGVGFLSQSFDGTLPGAHIYLVNGRYNPAPSSYNANSKARGAIAECGNVLVLSDNELICTMQLNRRLDETGGMVDPSSYINVLTTDVTTTGTNSSKLITSASGGFSQADVGQPILDTAAGTKIGPGVTVASVLSPTTAVLSANALTAGSGLTVVIGGAQVAVTNPGTGNDLTVASGLLVGDVNRAIAGPGIPGTFGSKITASATTTATVVGTLTGSAGPYSAVILGTPIASVVTAVGSATVTAPDSSFASSDIGRHIIGTGIQPGTTIVAVSALGAGATLSNVATAAGTVTVTVGGSAPKTVTGLAVTDTAGTVTAPPLTFSLADVGRTITSGSNIPSFVIATVTSGGAAATVTGTTVVGTGLVGTIAGGVSGGTAVPSVTKTDGTNTVTAAANTFTPNRVGMTITGPGIPNGTTITGVTFNGNGAMLSQPVVGSGAVTVYLYSGAPVPDGAYNLTYVTNGSLDAAALDAEYSQSTISSGSTFTVATS